MRRSVLAALAIVAISFPAFVAAQQSAVETRPVDGQPLGAGVLRLIEALEFLGTPLEPPLVKELKAAAEARDAKALQKLLDPRVLLVVHINPESRVKVERGPAPARLQQAGYTPVLVKVLNDSTVTQPLRIASPQAGAVYAGEAELSMNRQRQLQLKSDELPKGEKPARPDRGRFLQVEMFQQPPMTKNLSGLAAEYAIALVYSSEAGRREAAISFDVGQGNQDLGFRGEAPVLFDVRPAVAVTLKVKDVDGRPTVGRFTIKDAAGQVYPAQAKRLAPDFFFQQQVYRADGQTVLLPPGELSMQASRGPEYRMLNRQVTIPAGESHEIAVQLERWIDPAAHGYYSGDHHIHAAGCAHYTCPTEGVLAEDMFLQVKGEGLNVGCVLTWGPCYDYQRQFFSPAAHQLSEPLTLLKYDVEVSGFGSQALGHVCLLNLKDQTYPESAGTKSKGWPTWTAPVLKWAKEQGAVVGYAHSASGLQVDAAAAAKRQLAALDANADGQLSVAEAEIGLLTEPFAKIDADKSDSLSLAEIIASTDRVCDWLPNLAIPEMNGVGAQEVCVTTALGLCDFISSMDSARLLEWNCWYHVLNCGFPLRTSGETDFPCMSSTRVGQGRVYAQLGKVARVDFAAWCQAIAQGRSYVSDGYAHALDFQVNGEASGGTLQLDKPGNVQVTANLAFSSQTPLGSEHGGAVPARGLRVVGDTVVLHEPLTPGQTFAGERKVELIVNGVSVAERLVPADDRLHEVRFDVPVDRSSWIALRQFPQLHTNPVSVEVAGRPIRASKTSARWCIDVIEQLWRARGKTIAPNERPAAREAYDKSLAIYRAIEAEGQ